MPVQPGRKSRSSGSLLQSDPALLRSVRSAVDNTVRSFRFTSRDLREELAQEAMARILSGLDEGRFRAEASLVTYSRAVAKYTCLGYLRVERTRADIDPESLPATASWSEPEGLLLRREKHSRNIKAFLDLPRECQVLLQLVFIERLSYREAAERLGISEAAVKSRIHRCRMTGRTVRADRAESKGTTRRHGVRGGSLTS